MLTETGSKGPPDGHTPSASSGAPGNARESSAGAAASRPHAAPPGGGTHDAWAEQYKRESWMHAVGAILAVRAELMALLDHLPAVVRAVSILC